jgi:hypothetical protein
MRDASKQKIALNFLWTDQNASIGKEHAQVDHIKLAQQFTSQHGHPNLICALIDVLILSIIVSCTIMFSTVDTKTRKTVLTTP